jgi:hypothetical protein
MDGAPAVQQHQAPPASIDGLTPGTNYAIQVRALGRLGDTDWSDSATRISN